MPQLEDLFHIPDPSLHLRMDYSAKETRAEGSVGLSLRVWDMLIIAFALMRPMLKWYRRFRRGAQKRPNSGSERQSDRKP